MSQRQIDGKFSVKDEGAGLVIYNTKSGVAIPEDEPLFLFRAKDALAMLTLDYYWQLCAVKKCDSSQLDGVQEAIYLFVGFENSHETGLPTG